MGQENVASSVKSGLKDLHLLSTVDLGSTVHTITTL